jgi:hypothetical protein
MNTLTVVENVTTAQVLTYSNDCAVFPVASAVGIRSLLSGACRCLEAYSNGEMFEHVDQL